MIASEIYVTSQDRRNIEAYARSTAPKRACSCYVPHQKQQKTSERLSALRSEFKKGLILSRDDVIAKTGNVGKSTVKNIINELINDWNMDLLTVTRRGQLIGWILADEIL